jgi:hypothetical protein
MTALFGQDGDVIEIPSDASIGLAAVWVRLIVIGSDITL